MELLPHPKILEITEKAVEDGLDLKRNRLLDGLSRKYVSGLDKEDSPQDQLMSDLSAMNRVPKIIGDATPLQHWLAMASFLTGAFPDRQRYYGELAELVGQKAGGTNPAPGDAPAEIDTALLPERILFRNDLVPAGFITGASRTARAVARMIVPQIVGGQPVLGPTGEPRRFFGTGWLIGKGFLITNWHVAEARAPGEARAAIDDVKKQCQAAEAEFDYDSDDVEAIPAALAGL